MGIEKEDLLHNVSTHKDAWRSPLLDKLATSIENENYADESYYRHELQVFDETFYALECLFKEDK